MISKKLYTSLILSVILGTLTWSCSSDNYKFDNIKIKDIDTKVAVPIAYGKFILWNFIEGYDSEHIVKKEDGSIWFTYTKNDAFEYDLRDLYGFPQKITIGNFNINTPQIPNPSGTPIPIPQLDLTQKVQLVTSTVENKDLKLFEAYIESGLLNLTVTNPIDDIDANLKIRFVDAVKTTSRGIIPLEFNVKASPGTNNFKLPISKSTLKFETELNKDYLTVELQLSFDGTINRNIPSKTFTTSIAIENIEFGYIKADLGSHDIAIEKQIIDMDIDALDEIEQGIKFTNPIITITSKTNIVADSYISPIILGINKNLSIVDLNAPAYNIPIHDATTTDPLSYKIGNYNINKDNSNIVNFLGLPPNKEISFEGNVSINKDLNGNKTMVTKEKPNMIFPNSSFSADFKMETPLQFKAYDLSYSDTIDLKEEIEYITKSSLILKYKHEIPFEITAFIHPFDSYSQQVVGAEIAFPPIQSAAVDKTGHPTEVVKGSAIIYLTKVDLDNINATDKIIIKLIINTKGDNQAFMYGNQILNIELAADASATIEN
ncbi:hypothetical protein OAT16_06900 [Prolixibacteraceae bacterium]|nr:hypothetical protein [Prolixibacteraceae bacterium]